MRLSLLPKHKLTPVFWIKAALAVLPILVVLNLANRHVFLTPTLHYSYHPGEPTRSVGLTTATDIIRTADSSIRWKITQDSTPFTVTIPRLIEAVKVKVKLSLSTQPYVTLNAKGSHGTSSTIVYSAGLNALDWPHITKDGQTLWQRPTDPKHEVAQYSSLNAFRENPPAGDTVVVAGVDPMTFAVVESYKPSTTSLTINHQLRDSHRIYVYAANETIDFSFDKVDLNRQVGKDGVTVRVGLAKNVTSEHQDWLKTVSVGDDGNTKSTGPAGKPQHVEVKVPDVEPGVYVIDISATGDSLLTNITSRQHYLAFSGRIFLAEGPAYAQKGYAASTLFTNGHSVSVAAMHAQGQQTFTVDGKKYEVDDIRVDHTVKKLTGTSTINLPRGDAMVSSSGLLTFAPFSLLPGGAQQLDLNTTELDLEGVDYVVADYVPVSPKATSFAAEQQYSVSELSLLGKNLRFSIEAPGLQANGAALGLKSIEATLIRGPFPWDKLWQKLGLKQ